MKKISIITILILIIDQLSKIYVKTHFELGESISVIGDWCRLTFVENPGMAYGLEFGGIIGKYALIIVRVILIGGMIYLFRKWLKEGKTSSYLIVPMAMIFAGAIGNLIDGMFYGMIFNSGTHYDENLGQWVNHYYGISKMVPFGEGYSHFMKGCVVDMFHFPMVDWWVPDNYPIIGGKHIQFFSYIFNVADSAITLGGVSLYLFRKKAFPNGFEL